MPLTECHRLGEELGCRILFKREDLNHTGSHKINNVLGQALLAKRMGKTRIVAETGAGQHGVASATAAALFGMECVVYMGTVDIERQKLNAFRMQLLGAEVCAAETAARRSRTPSTKQCATGCSSRTPTTALARSWGRTRTRGWSASSTVSSVTSPASSAPSSSTVACPTMSSPASVAAPTQGIFAGFADTDAQLIGAEPAGGVGGRPSRSRYRARLEELLHAGRVGQVLEADRSRPGSTTRMVLSARPAASGRLGYEPVTDAEVEAFQLCSCTEGIIPAESAHALA